VEVVNIFFFFTIYLYNKKRLLRRSDKVMVIPCTLGVVDGELKAPGEDSKEPAGSIGTPMVVVIIVPIVFNNSVTFSYYMYATDRDRISM
jgi:hypothetical protein